MPRGRARAEDFRASSVPMRSLRVCELQARRYRLLVSPDWPCCRCEVVLITVGCVQLSCLPAAKPGESRRVRASSVTTCSLRAGGYKRGATACRAYLNGSWLSWSRTGMRTTTFSTSVSRVNEFSGYAVGLFNQKFASALLLLVEPHGGAEVRT